MSSKILENRLVRFTSNHVIFLLGICVIGLIIRLYYFPHGIPLSLDTLSYFFYANDVSILGKLPSGYHFPNNGWPLFVSFFFAIFQSNSLLDYMDLQRYISIALSIVTVIPVYFLCNQFVEKKYSILGATLFVLDPRIIQNSIQGDTQPLFILLIATTLTLFFSKNTKMIYPSFAVATLSALVRYEGLLLLIPFTIMYLIKFHKERRIILKFILVISIILVIIIPISYLRTISIGNDGLTSQVVGGAVVTHVLMKENNEKGGINFILNGLVNLIKSAGWITIPIFVFFVPTGIFYFVQKRESKTIPVLFIFFIMLIPALYAYSRDIKELRYLFPIFPIFCIFASLTIEKLLNKTSLRNIVTIVIVCGIIIASVAFIEYKKIDYNHEKEAFEISRHVSKITRITNDYYPETKYVRTPLEMHNGLTIVNGTKFGPEFIAVEGFDSLEKFIDSSNNRLDHLVLDGANSRPNFLNDVYYGRQEYPYLTKEFDSVDLGYKYHVKIYRIDYDKFEEYRNVLN